MGGRLRDWKQDIKLTAALFSGIAPTINVLKNSPFRGLGGLMNIPSLIFWAIFVLPLIAFLVWLMRQDKRKGTSGLVVLAIILIGCIVYMYFKGQF